MKTNEVIYHQEKNGYRYLVAVTPVEQGKFMTTTSISAMVPLTVSPAVPSPIEKVFDTYNEAVEYASILWNGLKEEYKLD